jgi:hypothetical protein
VRRGEETRGGERRREEARGDERRREEKGNYIPLLTIIYQLHV